MREGYADSEEKETKKLQAVVESRQSSSVQTIYEEQYEKKYGIKPIYVDPDETTAFGWLTRKLGVERACQLVIQYFTMNGDQDWYLRNCHSLPVLKKNAAIINAHLGKRGKHRAQQTYRGMLQCDSCWVTFDALYPADTNWMTAWIKCPECLLNNAPWKYPAKEEFDRRCNYLGVNSNKYDEVFVALEPYPNKELVDYELPEKEEVVRPTPRTPEIPKIQEPRF